MKTIRHIFAATDLSEISLHAVDRGFQLASTMHANYTVMHALGLDALGPLHNLLGSKANEVSRKVVEHQKEAISKLVQNPTRNRGVPAHVLVEEGLATTVLPAYAATTEADLVVVGAGGDNTLRRLFMGSTASHLLRKSKCPVLVVKNPGTQLYRHALVAVDFSQGAELSIRLAREMAPHAHLVLLHVFDVPFESMLQYAGVDEDEIYRYRMEARERSSRQLHQLAAQAGLNRNGYIGVIEHGDAAHHILEHEKIHSYDLIVMGKHGTHVTEELLLGSVTQRVLSRAKVDQLVVVTKKS